MIFIGLRLKWPVCRARWNTASIAKSRQWGLRRSSYSVTPMINTVPIKMPTGCVHQVGSQINSSGQDRTHHEHGVSDAAIHRPTSNGETIDIKIVAAPINTTASIASERTLNERTARLK
jgi:hypothetical protein